MAALMGQQRDVRHRSRQRACKPGDRHLRQNGVHAAAVIAVVVAHDQAIQPGDTGGPQVRQDDTAAAYETIRNELAMYGNGLDAKMEIVALNKCDALGPELAAEQGAAFAAATGIEPILLSAVAHDGTDKAIYALADVIQRTKAAQAVQTPTGAEDPAPEEGPQDWT